MRRVRVDSGKGVSPLERLKGLPEAERDALLAMREGATAVSVETLLRRIATQYRISGLSARRWSDFVRWSEEQRAIQEANASVDNLRAIYTEAQLEPEEVHRHCVELLRVTGMRQGDLRTLRFVTTEVRKAIELGHAARKLKVLEKKAEEAVQASEDTRLSAEEKAARIREIFKKG